MSMMEYKNYIAKIEYDDETESFQGRTVNTENIIQFYGYNAAELKANFHAAIDAYLAHCAAKGIEPAKTYSGQVRVRFAPDVHATISAAASVSEQSLNSFIAEASMAKAQDVLGRV